MHSKRYIKIMRRRNLSRPAQICHAVCVWSWAPIWVPIMCGHCLYRHFFPKPSAAERAFRKRYMDAPRPLPMTRCNISEVSISSDHASTSPLLRLPREIRDQIYSYLFVNKFVIRIDKIPHRLTQSRSLYPASWNDRQHVQSGPRGASEWPIPSNIECKLNSALIKTCRQIYLEATPLIYSTNTFQICDLDNLIYLNQTIRLPRMASIKYLQIQWVLCYLPLCGSMSRKYRPQDDETWLRFWNIVATRMTGLVALDISLVIWLPQLQSYYGHEKVWLKPLIDIRGLKQFVLDIVYGCDDDSRPTEDALAFRREIDTAVHRPRRPPNTQLWRARSFDTAVRDHDDPGTIEAI